MVSSAIALQCLTDGTYEIGPRRQDPAIMLLDDVEQFAERADRLGVAYVGCRSGLLAVCAHGPIGLNVLLARLQDRTQLLRWNRLHPLTVAVFPRKGVVGKRDLLEQAGPAALYPLNERSQRQVRRMTRSLLPRLTVRSALAVEPLDIAQQSLAVHIA